MPEPEPLNTVYECVSATEDPIKCNLRTVQLVRADGVVGWMDLTGTELAGLLPGRKYQITVELCQDESGPPATSQRQ